VDGATAFLICYGLVAADVTGLWSCPRPWVRAGDWSYALYLVHPAVIACVCFVWRRFSVPGLWDNAAVLVIVLVTCLSVAAQIFIRLERPTSRSAGAIMEALSRGMKRAMKPLAST